MGDPDDISVKVIVDEDGSTRVTFDKKALLDIPLKRLIGPYDVRIVGLQSPEELRLVRLQRMAPRMEAMIRLLEFVGYDSEEGYLQERCPICQLYQLDGQHKLDCELGDMIHDLDSIPTTEDE